MAELVERTDPDGVDFGWVMQVTFVVTILVGAPIVALLSGFFELPTWGARVGFAIRVGAPIWLLTAVSVFLYAKYRLDTEPQSTEEVSDSNDDGRSVEDERSPKDEPAPIE